MKYFIFTLIILTLAGCGGDNNPQNPEQPKQTQETQTEQTAQNKATQQTNQNQEEAFPADELEQLKESVTLKSVKRAKGILERNEDKLISSPDYISLINIAVKNNDLEMVKTLLPPLNWEVSTSFNILGLSVLVAMAALSGVGAIGLLTGGFILAAGGGATLLSLEESLLLTEKDKTYMEHPFHVAIELGHFDIVEYFVDNRYAWIFLENDQGQDAIELAESHGHAKIENYLKEEQFSISQIRQVFIFTNYLKDIGEKEEEDEDFFTVRATAFSTTSSIKEKEELYQYARDRSNLKSAQRSLKPPSSWPTPKPVDELD